MRRGKSSATSTLADRLLQVLLQKSRGGSLDGPAVLAALSELNDRDAALARQLEEAAEGQDGPKVTDSKGGEEGIGDGALLLDLAIKANCSASLLRAILDAFPGVSKRPGMRLGSSNSTALHQVRESQRPRLESRPPGSSKAHLFPSALRASPPLYQVLAFVA